MGSQQVFYWTGQAREAGSRTYYERFSLNKAAFSVGDCVYLFPEVDSLPPYIGRIVSAFVEKEVASEGQDPHCIEVKWYERRGTLEPHTKGTPGNDKEVCELEEVDVNPIGCISGKCTVIKARSYEEASQRMQGHAGDWYFCRGYFVQSTHSHKSYTAEELADPGPRPTAASGQKRKHGNEDVGDTDDLFARETLPELRDLKARQNALLSAIPLASGDDAAAGGHLPASLQHLSLPRPMLDAVALLDSLHHGNGYRGGQQHHHQHHHDDDEYDVPSSQRSTPTKRKNTGRVCLECGTTSTPQWREGPTGPKTLCNACGVRYVRAQQRGTKRGSATGGRSNPQSPAKLSGGHHPPPPVIRKSSASLAKGAPQKHHHHHHHHPELATRHDEYLQLQAKLTGLQQQQQQQQQLEQQQQSARAHRSQGAAISTAVPVGRGHAVAAPPSFGRLSSLFPLAGAADMDDDVQAVSAAAAAAVAAAAASAAAAAGPSGAPTVALRTGLAIPAAPTFKLAAKALPAVALPPGAVLPRPLAVDAPSHDSSHVSTDSAEEVVYHSAGTSGKQQLPIAALDMQSSGAAAAARQASAAAAAAAAVNAPLSAATAATTSSDGLSVGIGALQGIDASCLTIAGLDAALKAAGLDNVASLGIDLSRIMSGAAGGLPLPPLGPLVDGAAAAGASGLLLQQAVATLTGGAGSAGPQLPPAGANDGGATGTRQSTAGAASQQDGGASAPSGHGSIVTNRGGAAGGSGGGSGERHGSQPPGGDCGGGGGGGLRAQGSVTQPLAGGGGAAGGNATQAGDTGRQQQPAGGGGGGGGGGNAAAGGPPGHPDHPASPVVANRTVTNQSPVVIGSPSQVATTTTAGTLGLAGTSSMMGGTTTMQPPPANRPPTPTSSQVNAGNPASAAAAGGNASVSAPAPAAQAAAAAAAAAAAQQQQQQQQALAAVLAAGASTSGVGGDFHGMAMRAVKYIPELQQYLDLFADFDSIAPGLPQDTMGRLLMIKELVDNSSKEAAAADAAVQAVSQILVVRQEAADRAREAAAKAGQKLKEYLTALMSMHNVAHVFSMPPPPPGKGSSVAAATAAQPSQAATAAAAGTSSDAGASTSAAAAAAAPKPEPPAAAAAGVSAPPAAAATPQAAGDSDTVMQPADQPPQDGTVAPAASAPQ